MKHFNVLRAIAIIIATTLFASAAAAQSYVVHNEKKQAFLVTVFEKGRAGFSVGGQFCSASNGIVKQCASFFNKNGFFTPIGGDWLRKKGEREYGISWANGKLKVPPGRYYFMQKSLTNGVVEPGSSTYFADLSAGTVVVYTVGRVPMDTAVAYAKEQMSKQIGPKMLSLRFIAGGAVEVACSGQSNARTCRIGKTIPLANVSWATK